MHVPLLRRNGHLRALARTPSQQDQQDIVAGWALREKGRVAVKYGLDAVTVSFNRRRSRGRSQETAAGEAEFPNEDGVSAATGQKRKGRRRVTPLAGANADADADADAGGEGTDDDGDEDNAWSIARRQLAGPNGGQLGTTASSTSTSTTRTALSTAGFGTAATRVSGASSGSVNRATKTAPTTFPGPTQTVPVGEVHLLNYDADL